MLFTLQRYEFFSKSQHDLFNQQRISRCCLPCKGTNFLANHNISHLINCSNIDVVYLAKVRIFQQITTRLLLLQVKEGMLFTLQRYEFFSKSQQMEMKDACGDRCCLPCKGTNFLANHNRLRIAQASMPDVVYLAKVRIFQQITTEINAIIKGYRCCLPCKGTNFLANHNIE